MWIFAHFSARVPVALLLYNMLCGSPLMEYHCPVTEVTVERLQWGGGAATSSTTPSSPTPPSTPRLVDDLLALTQQLTPSKSPRSLHKIRHDIQLQANDVQQEHVTLKRRAVDAEQQVNLTRRPRKKRKHGDRTRNADDTEFNTEATEARIRNALFLIDDDILDTEEPKTSTLTRSATETSARASYVISSLSSPMMSGPRLTNHGYKTPCQRASICHRLRTEALHIIAENVKDFTTSASRFDAFPKFIGYKSVTGSSEAFYDRFGVPILYDQWDGKITWTIFSGRRAPQVPYLPLLIPIDQLSLEVFASIIRGPRGAEGLFEGKSSFRKQTCRCSTFSGIWLFSADTQLVKVGDETTIDYAARHVSTSANCEGLRDKKAWAIGSEQLEDDEEIDAIFAQASQVDSPPKTLPTVTRTNMINSGLPRRPQLLNCSNPATCLQAPSAISLPDSLATPAPNWTIHRRLSRQLGLQALDAGSKNAQGLCLGLRKALNLPANTAIGGTIKINSLPRGCSANGSSG
ncbi:hypothetical protein B0H17DRAFT_1136284 [Mycena rosella]|uniref:Uncharacterized protein n=1 Tax=Mycena rosella TaxID=1033263 RepID=A0AAD7DAY9_MYCRO|nr:hypothetical protein B0H17DRAFT_1136284 [Mycena rosella]